MAQQINLLRYSAQQKATQCDRMCGFQINSSSKQITINIAIPLHKQRTVKSILTGQLCHFLSKTHTPPTVNYRRSIVYSQIGDFNTLIPGKVHTTISDISTFSILLLRGKTSWRMAIKTKHSTSLWWRNLCLREEGKKLLELAYGSAFVNEHLTKKNHLTTHMIVSKTPLTPEADNAKFKSYHLGTSVHTNCLSTATTHVKDIFPLQKRTLWAIKRSS